MTDQRLTRPIMGLENRTPQEVFNIMCDRIFYAQTAPDMATPADIAAAARRMDVHASQEAKPDGNAQSEAVAYIQAAALSELLRHKQATTTVCSGLLKAHPDAIPLYTHPAPPLAVTDEVVEGAVMNQERKRARLPALGSELLEFYPAMSAQTHEHAVKDYARNAIQASAKQVDEAMIGRAYQAAYDALLGTSADIGVGELDRLVRAALTAALEAKQ